MIPEVLDFRRAPRFVVDPPIVGAFDGHEVYICNIGETGLQVEYPSKIPRGTFGVLRFSLPGSEKIIRLSGRTAWCRMVKKHKVLERIRYRIGVRIEGLSPFTIETLAQLLKAKLLRPEKDSMEKKRRLVQERARPADVAAEVSLIPAPVTLDDCIVRVQSARALLSTDPGRTLVLGEEGMGGWSGPPPSLEMVAVWQFLNRSVDPAIVALIFELYPGKGESSAAE